MVEEDDRKSPCSLDEVAGLIVDTHCHPTDDPSAYGTRDYDALLARIGQAPLWRLVCMSTNARDQPIVSQLAQVYPEKVIPCFGWHPWFSHQISLQHPCPTKEEHYRSVFGESDEVIEIWDQLPEPISLHDVLHEIRQNFERFPQALLGEVGVDRAFRIPRKRWSYDPSSEPPPRGPKLTKLKTPQSHQLAVLRGQIDVALQYRRNISLHSVQAAGITVDLLNSLRNADPTLFGSIRVSIHSCTLDSNVVASISKVHPNVYFGFSSAINSKQFREEGCLYGVDRSKALLESDYHTIEGMPDLLHQGIQYFAKTHQLNRVQAARQLQQNWKEFYSIYEATESDHSSDEEV